MPQPRKSLPRYLKHASGKGRIVWTDATGTRREKLLPGPYNSPESLEAFARLQLELTVRPASPKLSVTDTGPTVAEILFAYLKFAEAYYAGGNEVKTLKDAIKPVRQLYGMTPAADFGPLALEAVRGAMVAKGWARSYCNAQANRVIRAFKWCVSRQLIPPAVYQSLKTLAPLKAGKTDARESEARLPANPDHVAATLPHLQPHTRALVELLRLTGMRPSETCRMTLGRIDRTAPVWVYTPKKHKTMNKGKHRAILLGPAAQAVLVSHLERSPAGDDEAVFSPARQKAEALAARRAGRKTKWWPSHVRRAEKAAATKKGTKRLPGAWFKSEAVGNAVERACEKAGVPAWSPYQLRHLKGAELREKFSLEHVRAVLGHSHASMSAHYAAGADAVLAAEVAGKVG